MKIFLIFISVLLQNAFIETAITDRSHYVETTDCRLDTSIAPIFDSICCKLKECRKPYNDSLLFLEVKCIENEGSLLLYADPKVNAVTISQKYYPLIASVKVQNTIVLFRGYKDNLNNIHKILHYTNKKRKIEVNDCEDQNDIEHTINLCGECRNSWVKMVHGVRFMIFTEMCMK